LFWLYVYGVNSPQKASGIYTIAIVCFTQDCYVSGLSTLCGAADICFANFFEQGVSLLGSCAFMAGLLCTIFQDCYQQLPKIMQERTINGIAAGYMF
jgi:hypothetical protein